MSSSVPIACTLPAGALAERTARFATLNRTALRSVVREPRAATLTYAAAAAGELEALVQLERECCAFLDFALVRRGDDVVTLRIEAPDVDGAAHLLASFLEGTESYGPAAPLASTEWPRSRLEG